MATSQRICILGGGFGGLYTALKLQNYPWSRIGQPEITLIDQNKRFVFLPFLYELLTDEMQTWEIAPTFEQLLKDTSIKFVQDEVQSIDSQGCRVSLNNQGTLDCDYLVLALGGETPLTAVPGAQDYAIPFRSLADATQLQQKLHILEQSAKDPIKVAVVGAGPSGVELACKLSDRLGARGEITLLDRNDAILKTGSTFNQQAALKALGERQVTLKLNTGVKAVTAEGLELDTSEQSLAADLILWTVGNTMPEAIRNLDLPKNDRGQIQTQATMQVQDHPHIFAIGDLATGVDVNGQPIPQTAQAAFQASDYVAWNLWATISDRQTRGFRYSHLGEMLTLGRDEAALAGLGLTLDGPLANLARRAIYLYRFPTPEHQFNVGLQWLLKPFQSASGSGETP